MNRIHMRFLSLIAVLGLLWGGSVFAQSPAVPAPKANPAIASGAAGKPGSTDGRLTIGVTPVKVTPAVKDNVAKSGKTNSMERVVQALDGQLIDRLNNTRKFAVLGRSDIDAILKEQELAGSGNVDISDENAAKAFQMAGAKYIIVATLDDFQDYVEKAVFEGIGAQATKRKIRVSAVAKIYDTTTNKLLESTNFQIDEKDLSKAHPNTVSTNGDLSDEMLLTLSREMAGKIANRVLEVLFPAKIMAKTGKIVTINRGEGTGIEKGQLWDVYALGEELIDPDTGMSLGSEEIKVGQIRISVVRPLISQGEVLEDLGIEKLQVVRPTE